MLTPISRLAGAWPVSMAMACSSSARAMCISVRCALAPANWVCAKVMSDLDATPPL